MYIQVFLYL